MGNAQEWADGIKKELTLFSASVNDKVYDVAKDVAKKAVAMLKETGGYEDRTGKYRKSFRYKVEKTYKGTEIKVYSTQPQLTHLLEHGHATVNGTGRTRAFPHWEPTEEFATKEFEKQIERVLSE